jgi:uncharacterized protein involved in exopolysaccharide biosynthesis
VQEAVTNDTNVPGPTISDRVTVNRVGSSGLVAVTYTTPINNDPKAEAVVSSVVQNTLSLMYEATVKGADRAVQVADDAIKSAQATQTQAQNQVNAFLAARNYISPADELANVTNEINQLQVREVDARASGNIAAANTYAATLAQMSQHRSDLGKDAVAFEGLQSQVDAAKTAVGRAQEAKETAQRDEAQLTPEGQTTFGQRNAAEDRTATIWRRTLAVMAACFILSVLLVAWLATLSSSDEGKPAPAPAEEAPEDMAVTIEDAPEEAEEPVPARSSSRTRTRLGRQDPDGVAMSAQQS